MSKKRSVSYIKPIEPAFLTRLKEQAGYIEGPTIETKRESLPDWNKGESIEDEKTDESPVVVVLKPGDLTQEEANIIKNKKEEEEANRPAQLDERIVFKPRNKRLSEKEVKPSKKPKHKAESSKTNLLSFGSDEDQE